jgi:glycosyltransferase involved in cell wall biosynthesis
MSPPADVAVVIPAHNALPDVIEAVESALAQQPAPAEVIVVDDDSTDGTGGAVRARFGGRVVVVSGRFGSAGAARNAGWRAARARWIALLDADDLWYPGKLAAALELLERHPEAAWFFSDAAFRSIDGEWHDSWFGLYAEVPDPYLGQPVAELFDVNFALTSTVVIRRDALETTGGFDEGMSHAEDLDLLIRLARCWPAVATTRTLVVCQHLPSGLSQKVEARVGGNYRLFDRLAADPTLPPELRRRARRRASLSAFKLAWSALRDRRRADARRALARAWLFPERVLPVAVVWTASLLPESVLEWLRRQGRTKRTVAAPMLRTRRVVLRARNAPGAEGGVP